MEQAVYEQVLTGLQRNGITVTVKGLFRTGSNGKATSADGSQVFNTFQVTADDFMHEYKARNESKKSSYVNARNGYSEITFMHPKISYLDDWSKADEDMFGRFSFAVNHVDDSFIILIKQNNSSYAAVPFSGKPSLTVGALTSKCTLAEANNPKKYKNLYEELTVGFRNRLQYVVDQWASGKLTKHDDFVAELGKYVPHCMLKRLSLKLMVEKKTLGGNNNGDDQIEIFNPCEARFTETPQSSSTIEPMEFIAKFFQVFLGRPEMQAPMPKIFTNDPSVPALCYIDLNTLAIPGPCPTWHQYMKRYRPDEAKVFKAYLWCIFVADNTGRQILYILDVLGFSAKSMVIAAIIETLGNNMCTSLQKDSMNNQFSLAKVWDKRLVTYGDNKNPNLIMSEKLHMMTGGDYAEIEMKGRNSFHAKLMTKIIASGNTPLDIHPDARHEISRVIIVHPQMNDEILKEFCKLNPDGTVMRRHDGEPVFLGDSTFGERLKKEFRHFLVECKEAYAELCPTNSQIEISDEMYDDITSNAPISTAIISDYFADNFEHDANARMTMKEYVDAISALMQDVKDKNVNADSFKEYIQKKYPDVKFGVTIRQDGKVTKGIRGLKLKYVRGVGSSYDAMKPAEPPKFNPISYEGEV